MKIKTKGEGIDKALVYPYKAVYFSKLVSGSPARAKLILDMWKDCDDNTLNRQLAYIADTIVFALPNGTVIRRKENFVAESQTYRNQFTTVKSTVEAWTPLKSVDRNEDRGAIRGWEEITDKEGKAKTRMIHEIWRINKDGKIDFSRHYTAEKPKPQPEAIPKPQ